MKKILSLLIATTLMLSAFAGVVSANAITSSNKATLTISVEEEATPSSAAATYADEQLFLDPGYKVYKIDIVAGNLPELIKASNTSYTGDGITAATAAIKVESDGDYDMDWGVLPKKGSGAWNGTTYDWYAGTETTLFNNVGVAQGDSQVLTYLEVIVADGIDVDFSFTGGSLGAAIYSANRPNQGTGFYNVTVEGGNLQLVAYPAAEEPGVAPVEAVATVAEDATGLTDLNGDAVTLDADYGIAKFDTPINTGLNKYYIVAKTATETSPDFLVDFTGAVEAEGNIAFYAIVKSTHGPITSLTLKAVANE